MSCAVVPYGVYRLLKPTIRRTPGAAAYARAELIAMGPLSRSERIALVVMCAEILGWVSSQWTGLDVTVVAFAGLAALLITNVLTWEGALAERNAWDVYVWYGGLLGALFTALYYFRRRPELRAWLYADAFAPAIAAGAVVGRIGCFLAGCCHGRPTDVPWAVKFVTTAVPVHPTQLYDALAALILAVPLYLHFPRRRFDGENIALLLMGYAALRALSEAFRGDAERGALGPISTSQAISIPLFLAGVAIWQMRSRPRVS